jgi:hypothetical protein
MNVFYSDSKTDLKIQCVYFIKFQLFEGVQDVAGTLTAVCFMLLLYNPTGCGDYPSTTRGTSVGPPIALNILYIIL